MKNLLLLILCLAWAGNGICQIEPGKTILATRLYSEIKTYKQIEHQFIGCFGHPSLLYKKIDSLRLSLGKEAFIQYFDSASYVLKYQVYFSILIKNDSVAFEKLKNNINDTTKIEFTDSWNGVMKFNELLAGQYLGFIKAKYLEGLRGTHQGQPYYFERKDIRKWMTKSADFYAFITEKGLDKNQVEYYSR
ncbi:hypothetical protein [Ferruginibacter sp.]